MIRMTCPCCGTQFPWEAGLQEDDAKRLAAVLADMEPALARAAMLYLRFFKPPKTALRMTRATKILRELAALFAARTVCADERTNIRRPAPPAVWVAGIEQMLQQADSLTLPLEGHGYLRKVVYTLADKADATAERRHEQDLRAGRRSTPRGGTVAAESKLQNELAYLTQMLKYGQIEQAEYERSAAAARAQHGAQP